MPEYLASWIYLSKARQPFSIEALHELTDYSTERNREFGITGYLVYLDGKFVQYIEGEPTALRDLKRNILGDERHDVLQHTGEERISLRRFPNWFMRWVTDDDFASVSLENNLAEILEARDESVLGSWELTIWLTLERVVALDRRICEKFQT